MKKTTKGALAAAAAGTLLLGGAGSLAFWNATATVAGGTLNSGSLKLVAGADNCTPFVLDDDEPATAGPTVIVPGDTLTKTCTYTVNATGNHLRANLSAVGPQFTSETLLAADLDIDASFTVDGSAVSSITSDNDGDVLEAKIVLTFDPESDNATQLGTATLGNYVVTATQVHN